MEFANPDLGLLGALSPAQNTGQQMGGDIAYDPRSGQYYNARTGQPVPPPGMQSLFAMMAGGRN